MVFYFIKATKTDENYFYIIEHVQRIGSFVDDEACPHLKEKRKVDFFSHVSGL